MLYLVGGAPRAGKSTLAREFLAATGVPHFGIDYLKMGIARGLPEYGVDPNNDDLITARQLWPVVRGMAMTYVENEEDCLLEGAYLLPEYVAELQETLNGQIRACFVGFAEVDTMLKVRQMRDHAAQTGHGDWTSDEDDEAMEHVEFLKEFSSYVRDACSEHGLRYFETSTDHWKSIRAAVQYLSERKGPSCQFQEPAP